MFEMEELTKEILDVVEACRGGVDTPLSIDVFITLTQRLELLFSNFTRLRTREKAINCEHHLLEAIQLCMLNYLKHFEFDVLQHFVVTEPQTSYFDDIVHPVMQALERLLATACDHAKSFESETLKEQMYQYVTATFGFIPTLDHTQLSSTCAVSSDFEKFLCFSSSSASADEASLPPGLPSRGTSTDSDEIITPTVVEALGNAYFLPSSKISDAPQSASPSSSRSLAEGMDVTDIISCGLGLSDGHRDQCLRTNRDSDITACSLPHAERDQPVGTTEVGSGQAFSSESTNERKVPLDSKRSKGPTTKKRVSGKRKTTSPCSSPNKENMHQ